MWGRNPKHLHPNIVYRLSIIFLCGAGFSALADDLTATGEVYDQTCYTVVTDQLGRIVTDITIPRSISEVDLGNSVGLPTVNNPGVPFGISARTSVGNACNLDPETGARVSSFVPLFDSKLSLHDENGKPFNHGNATGVTIDLVPFAIEATASGLDLRKTTAVEQYGISRQIDVEGSMHFTAKYYKINTATAGPGDVVVKFTVINQYQ